MTEAATVTDEQEPRRCSGVTADGSQCGAPSELVLSDGFCFPHSPRPGTAEKLRAAGTLGGNKTGARMRKGIDVGDLNTPEDAVRITARIATAVASGELPAAQGRTVLVAIAEWRKCFEADVLDKRLAELEKARER